MNLYVNYINYVKTHLVTDQHWTIYIALDIDTFAIHTHP